MVLYLKAVAVSPEPMDSWRGRTGDFAKIFLINDQRNKNGWRVTWESIKDNAEDFVKKPGILFLKCDGVECDYDHTDEPTYQKNLDVQENYRKTTMHEIVYDEPTRTAYAIHEAHDPVIAEKFRRGETMHVSPAVWPVKDEVEILGKMPNGADVLDVYAWRALHTAFVNKPAYGDDAKIVSRCSGTGEECRLGMLAGADDSGDLEPLQEIPLLVKHRDQRVFVSVSACVQSVVEKHIGELTDSDLVKIKKQCKEKSMKACECSDMKKARMLRDRIDSLEARINVHSLISRADRMSRSTGVPLVAADVDDKKGNWITMNGTPIFIPDGADKSEIIKEKINELKQSKPEKQKSEKKTQVVKRLSESEYKELRGEKNTDAQIKNITDTMNRNDLANAGKLTTLYVHDRKVDSGMNNIDVPALIWKARRAGNYAESDKKYMEEIKTRGLEKEFAENEKVIDALNAGLAKKLADTETVTRYTTEEEPESYLETGEFRAYGEFSDEHVSTHLDDSQSGGLEHPVKLVIPIKDLGMKAMRYTQLPRTSKMKETVEDKIGVEYAGEAEAVIPTNTKIPDGMGAVFKDVTNPQEKKNIEKKYKGIMNVSFELSESMKRMMASTDSLKSRVDAAAVRVRLHTLQARADRVSKEIGAPLVSADTTDEKGNWITMNGTPVFIPDGEKKEDVIKQKISELNKKNDKKESAPKKSGDKKPIKPGKSWKDVKHDPDYGAIWGGHSGEPPVEFSKKIGDEIRGNIGFPTLDPEDDDYTPPDYYDELVTKMRSIGSQMVSSDDYMAGDYQPENALLTVRLPDADYYPKWKGYMEKAMKVSPTLKKAQKELDKTNDVLKEHVANRGSVIRGGSAEELKAMIKHKGKVGYHKRDVGSMKGQNFVSTTIDPSTAKDFSNWDKNDDSIGGIVMEFDTTDMPDDHIKANNYNFLGIATANKKPKGITWPSESFGGKYTPKYAHQKEIHFLKGSKPRLTKVTMAPSYDGMPEDSKRQIRDMVKQLEEIQGDSIEVVDSGFSKAKTKNFSHDWVK